MGEPQADRFLSDLSILFNFSMYSQNPFLLIMSGLPYFMDKLSLNQNQSLTQRIVMRYYLESLSKEEIANYINHQLKLAGSNHPIFTPQAVSNCTTFPGTASSGQQSGLKFTPYELSA